MKIFLAGWQRVRMDDGTEMEFGPGGVAVIHPGNDAWVVGDEPNVLIELADIVKMSANAPEEMLTKFTLEAVQRFNDAINRHGVGAAMAAMTADCVFENTYPPPDGGRYEGQAAVRAFWERFFATNPDALFEVEKCLPSPIGALSDGFTERRKKESRGICAAWMCFVCGMGR
nr:nuclear transport factor 2 family protein [Calidithermus roseus]